MASFLMTYGAMLVLGALLGAVFFGGLWLTVQQMPHAKRPALLFVTSALGRTVIVMAGFWYFCDRDPLAIMSCLAGLIIARMMATHRLCVPTTVSNERKAH